jgi:hypothetical protein
MGETTSLVHCQSMLSLLFFSIGRNKFLIQKKERSLSGLRRPLSSTKKRGKEKESEKGFDNAGHHLSLLPTPSYFILTFYSCSMSHGTN